MSKVRIEGFARLIPSGEVDSYGSDSRDVEDEIIELSEGDVIASDGPISFEIVEEGDADND